MRAFWERTSRRGRIILVTVIVLVGVAIPIVIQLVAKDTPPARPPKEARPSPTTPATLRPNETGGPLR